MTTRRTVGDVSGRETDDAMTRSEEELHVGTTARETGRVRLRKYIVTENVTQTVPVKREEVRLEREPITDANRDTATAGADLSEEEHEVVLHEEQVDVSKTVVPKERVALGADTVTDEREVSEEVRKEQIEMIDGDGEPAEGRDGQRDTDDGSPPAEHGPPGAPLGGAPVARAGGPPTRKPNLGRPGGLRAEPAEPRNGAHMATKTKSKGVSLAKGPVGLIGMALLAFGVLALIFGGRGFEMDFPSGTQNGKRFLGVEGNGWTNLLFIGAGALLLFGSPTHWGAKGLSLIVGLAPRRRIADRHLRRR